MINNDVMYICTLYLLRNKWLIRDKAQNRPQVFQLVSFCVRVIMSSNFDEKAGVVWVTTDWGRWHQTAQEVNVEVELEEGTRGKEVNVTIAAGSIECVVRGALKFKVQSHKGTKICCK